jgi:hypothetical protein
MIRTMSSARLHLAGRVTGWLTLLCCIIAALVIGALVLGSVHPPRSLERPIAGAPG